MAARPRRSKQKQNPLVEHGEKLAFGLFVLGLGWAVYGAITHPTYEKRPETLEQTAKDKLTQIQNAKPDDGFRKQFPAEDFAEKVKVANQPIHPDPFIFITPLNFDGGTGLGEKRGQPELASLADINARFVRMSLAMVPPAAVTGAPGAPGGGAPGTRPRGLGGNVEDPGSGVRLGRIPGGMVGLAQGGGVQAPIGSIPKGKMAIVVVGRVPVKEQVEMYRKAFRNSRFNDPDRDSPSYVSFLIERADVTDDEANPKWTAVNASDQSLIQANLLEAKDWALEAPEIVDLRHVRRLALNPDGAAVPWEGFTFPLPPRLLEDWSTEVTSKTIKKIDPEALLGVPGQVPGEAEPAPKPAGGNPFANPPANPFQNPQGGAAFDRGANHVRNRQQFVAQQLPGARMPGGAFAGQRMNPDLEGMPGGLRNQLPGDEIPDILFRFFDFQIQLNHRYRYRVRLVLRNPNFELPERYLQNAELGKSQFVLSPDSDPSPVVAVSGYSEVLAGPVKPSVGISDASASVIIRNRDAETGATIAYEFPGIERGTLLNFTVVKKIVGKDKTEVGPLKPNPVDGSVTVADKAVFNSNEILLDMRGGDKVPGSPTNRVEEPSGVLVLDESGRLAVRGPLADQQTDFVEAQTRLKDLATKIAKPETPDENKKKEDEEGRPSKRGNGLGGKVGGDP